MQHYLLSSTTTTMMIVKRTAKTKAMIPILPATLSSYEDIPTKTHKHRAS